MSRVATPSLLIPGVLLIILCCHSSLFGFFSFGSPKIREPNELKPIEFKLHLQPSHLAKAIHRRGPHDRLLTLRLLPGNSPHGRHPRPSKRSRLALRRTSRLLLLRLSRCFKTTARHAIAMATHRTAEGTAIQALQNSGPRTRFGRNAANFQDQRLFEGDEAGSRSGSLHRPAGEFEGGGGLFEGDCGCRLRGHSAGGQYRFDWGIRPEEQHTRHPPPHHPLSQTPHDPLPHRRRPTRPLPRRLRNIHPRHLHLHLVPRSRKPLHPRQHLPQSHHCRGNRLRKRGGLPPQGTGKDGSGFVL
mmetsp:Transcript_11722/g.23969  ORF Transcript_11722/g.23969 Transcript_11722/m.23969 type:complete len:301 (-) Transcript_11722:1307-2209(-)